MFDSNYINTVYENYKKNNRFGGPNNYLYQLLDDIKSKNLVEDFKQDLLTEAKVLEDSFINAFVRKENSNAKIINNLVYDFTILQNKFKYLSYVLFNSNLYKEYDVKIDTKFTKSLLKEAEYYKKHFTSKEIEILSSYDYNNIFELDIELIKKIHAIDISKYIQYVKTISNERFNQMVTFLTKSKYQTSIKGVLDKNILNVQDIVYILFSKIKDTSFLKANLDDDKDFRFNKYSAGLDLNFLNEFTEYKAFLNSDKTTLEDVDKLIFIKNLIQWCEHDCFVDIKDDNADNYMYSLYMIQSGKYVLKNSLIQRMRKLQQNLTATKQKLHSVYNNFNEKDFVEMQANYIFNPKLYDISFYQCQIDDYASVIKEGILYFGCIVSINSHKAQFIHVCKDLNVNDGNFEIQLNMLCENKLENRIQLLRIDNYATDGVHKNWGGQKIKTKTHVHIYNQFDLIRGRVNGNFDIAYNLENKHQSFDEALNTLFKIINFESKECEEKIKNLINQEIDCFYSNNIKPQ